MLKIEPKQLNFYSLLYHKIPENHILKLINSAISLNFINEMLSESYCTDFGRPAKEPEMMFRILLLQYLYNLSDERVIEELKDRGDGSTVLMDFFDNSLAYPC